MVHASLERDEGTCVWLRVGGLGGLLGRVVGGLSGPGRCSGVINSLSDLAHGKLRLGNRESALCGRLLSSDE